MSAPVSPAHPSARARGHHLARTLRTADSLVGSTMGPHRSVALATMAVRGAAGRGQEAFAVAYGLDVGLVMAMEQGEVAAEQIPAPLVALTPIMHLVHDQATAQGDSAA